MSPTGLHLGSNGDLKTSRQEHPINIPSASNRSRPCLPEDLLNAVDTLLVIHGSQRVMPVGKHAPIRWAIHELGSLKMRFCMGSFRVEKRSSRFVFLTNHIWLVELAITETCKEGNLQSVQQCHMLSMTQIHDRELLEGTNNILFCLAVTTGNIKLVKIMANAT
ncbi:hypothetical protein L1887_16176 [Cichorium endivia]|nr:hypothetical protein L1887_16176 [Cichorium endivia]